MSILHGKDGVIKYGSTPTALPGKLQSWNIDEQADTASDWGMGDTYETTTTTIKRWSGSFELRAPAAMVPGLVVGTKFPAEFYPGGEVSGTGYYSGDVILTSKASSAAKDGYVTVTCNFMGDGPLTEGAVA